MHHGTDEDVIRAVFVKNFEGKSRNKTPTNIRILELTRIRETLYSVGCLLDGVQKVRPWTYSSFLVEAR
jgi:hypothetical protein